MTDIGNKENAPAGLSLRYSEVLKIYEKKSDSEVWKAFDKGDESAFNYLYRTYMPVMYRYGMQITQEQHVIQDGIQNVFIYLRSKRGSLSDVSCIKAYLLKSLSREVIGKISKNRKLEFRDVDDIESSFLVEVSAESKLIEFEVSAAIKLRLESGINQLTPRHRQAILLLYEEGLSYRQIAEVFDLGDVKSARKLIYRALHNLKEILNNNK